jgi:hypothetical protein
MDGWMFMDVNMVDTTNIHQKKDNLANEKQTEERKKANRKKERKKEKEEVKAACYPHSYIVDHL